MWVILGVMVFFAALKEQVVLGQKTRQKVAIAFPQGWSFFTKSPRDEALSVYRVINGQIEALPMSNHQNIGFGLSRNTRLIGYEASIVASSIHPSKWKSYKNRPIESFVNDSVIIVQQKPGFHHFTKGEYIFKLFKNIPFAWAGQQQETNTPFKITRISIQ